MPASVSPPSLPPRVWRIGEDGGVMMRSEDLKVKLLPVTLGEVAGVCPRKPQ